MHIAVVCPHCASRFQLDPSLRGKRMRCPNALCRAVFEVRAEGETPPAPVTPPKEEGKPAPKPVISGTVSELVPMLPAEAVELVVEEKKVSPAKPPVPEKQPAPPLKRPAQETPPPPPSPLPAPPGDDEVVADGPPPDDFFAAETDAGTESADHSPSSNGPRDFGPGAWEAPPVRFGDRAAVEEFVQETAAATALLEAPVPEMPAVTDPIPIVKARRRSLAIILGMLVVLGAAFGGGIYLVSGRGAENEAERFKKTQELYQNQEYAEAAVALQKLAADFPASKNRLHYRFLAELSDVREAVYGPLPQPEERAGALDRVLQFLEFYKNDPLLQERHGDVWHTLQRLAKELTALAERNQEDGHLKRAERAWTEAGKFQPPAATNVEDAARNITGEIARVHKALAARAQRLELLETLKGLAGAGSAEAVIEGRGLVLKAGLQNDAEVQPLLAELVKAHRAAIVFTPVKLVDASIQAKDRVPSFADRVPSFYVAPLVGKSLSGPKRTGVVLAQARGVLYALDPGNGEVRWVRRVGVDTTLLPLRVPASPIVPERVLALSSDSKTLTALEAETGAVLWQHPLGDVCLGQPVLVNNHVLVPTLAGRVEEIETTAGRMLGYYSLGQPLVVGGVHQPGTTLVYFPADSFSIYVLDVAKRHCAGILYTGHAPGSLRGEPAVWNEGKAGVESPKDDASGWLLLSLAAGADGVEMKPYALPFTNPDQKAANPIVKVRGRSWGAPWQDGDRLALATDAGLLGLFGIRQKGNRDPLLFPLLKEDYALAGTDQAGGSRAQVVHVDADNYWVLTGGQLHRLQRTFTALSGPGLVPRWPQPPRIGSPLHAAQVHVEDGRTILYVATQETGRPTCWLRAFDADLGKVLWQRQLGMVCQGQAVAVGDTVLCPDAAGVFLFDAASWQEDKEKPWQPAGVLLDQEPYAGRQVILAHGKDFVHLSWEKEAVSTLHLRRIDAKGQGTARTFALSAAPMGRPALGSDCVLVQLANGIVVRLPLGEGLMTTGPDWRGAAVDEAQLGHVVALSKDEFALTDGGRSVVRFHWGDAKLWDKRGSAELPFRIVTPPAALSGKLLVADASGTVTLLEGDRLQATRRWTLGEKISAGPFEFSTAKPRGESSSPASQGALCVLGQKRLVFLDPAQDQPAWEYTFVAPVVGQPALVDGLLIVANVAGGLTALDPASGRPVGPGYTLRANVAPAAAPVPFGPGRLWLPLTDGTGMVLSLNLLTK